jgi:hypothetical protein
MRINPSPAWIATGLLLALSAAFSAGQATPAPSAIDQAQRQVTAYLAKLADLHCTESVVQEKLAHNGHVEATERAKYDYLIMIDGNGDSLSLNESRIESAPSPHKQLPMLVTNGFSTALLVFHPYYRDSFQFETSAEETVNGKPALPIHFVHVPGRRTPAALALRGREYPLELQGTAWLDKQSGDVVKLDATLLSDMSDVGLRSMNVHVEYKSTNLGKTSANMPLPALAVVDVTTLRQHWRNTHIFDTYKTFSTDAEQDPNVKVHAETATAANDNTAAATSTETKEKP